MSYFLLKSNVEKGLHLETQLNQESKIYANIHRAYSSKVTSPTEWRFYSINYGLNFSDMDFLREFTRLSYQVIFTGVE